eukprot:3985779-Amphidinium_carterae.1
MAQKKKSAQQPAPETPGKLMDKKTSASTVKCRKRPESRITPEEQTSTAIYDNLAGRLSNFEIYALKVDGETCQERILRMKVENAKNPGVHVMGKIFWEELRRLYSSSDRVEKKLVYPPGTTCSPELQELASWLYKTPPNRHKLMSHLDRTEA